MIPERLPKELFKACMFAKTMIENGTPPGLANYKSGQYYGYSASDVGWARTQLKQARPVYSNNKKRAER